VFLLCFEVFGELFFGCFLEVVDGVEAECC